MLDGCDRIAPPPLPVKYFGMKLTTILLSGALSLSMAPAIAAPSVLVDAASGDILYEHEATVSWHPASLTKLMTAHLALNAVRRGEVGLASPVQISSAAAAVPPSKIGLPVGHALRLEDALRVMLVRSTNDIAYAIAETVGGSHDQFVASMNAEATRLGMTGTRFINAHGLHDDRQVTNARDMAVLAIAVMRAHRDHSDLFRTPFVTVMNRRMKNTNDLLGKYPGIDGMKTGYVCASGFNLVASASRNGHQLVSVVMGAPSARQRGEITSALLDIGFSGAKSPVGNLRTVKAVAPGQAADLRRFRCGKTTAAVPGRDSTVAGTVARPGTGRSVVESADPLPARISRGGDRIPHAPKEPLKRF